MSESSFSLLRRLDQRIFDLEQRLVTIAALLMTSTVCLDIVYRSLKGQQNEPFLSLMTLYGILGEGREGLPTSWFVPIFFILTPFAIGWAVYASLHRGEEGNLKRALSHGLLWSIGAYLSALLIYSLPSKYVCMLLVLGVGGLITVQGRGVERWINLSLTILVTWGAFSLPQGYIWSQELSLILLAWVAFLGASMATFQNKHIQISALAGVWPAAMKPYIRPIGLIATGLFSAYISSSLMMSVFGDKGSFASGETRPATGMPAWVILFSGVIAFSLITLRSLAYGYWSLLHPKDNTEEEIEH